jgi:hypothetical protein
MPVAPQTEPPSKRIRTVPNGPLWCPELGRSLPLELSIPQAAALVGRSERAMYRAKELDQLPGVRSAAVSTGSAPRCCWPATA